MSVSILFMHTAAGCPPCTDWSAGVRLPAATLAANNNKLCKEKATNPSQQIFIPLHFLLFPKVLVPFINCLKQTSSVKLSIEPVGGAAVFPKLDVRNHLYHHLLVRVRNKWKTDRSSSILRWKISKKTTSVTSCCLVQRPRLKPPTMTAHFHLSKEIFK